MRPMARQRKRSGRDNRRPFAQAFGQARYGQRLPGCERPRKNQMRDRQHAIADLSTKAARRSVIGTAGTAIAAFLMALLMLSGGQALAQTSQPRTVSFPSADGKTTLVGYLFAPAGRPKTAACRRADARAAAALFLARQGQLLCFADHRETPACCGPKRGRRKGYWALIVDSFWSARGYPAWFRRRHRRCNASCGRQRNHRAAARCLWGASLPAHVAADKARPDRLAGLVEWRQRGAGQHGSG